MTNPTPHGQVPESLRLADALEYCDASVARQAINELRRQHARIAELEAEIAAVGAGGVSGPLMGIAAPPTAQAEGWRPIAEHDGSACDVHLYCEDSREQFIGFPGPLVGAFQYCAFPGGTMSCRPSHWRPLPPPPTSAEGVEHG